MILLRKAEKNALLELKTFDRIFSGSKVAQKHFFKEMTCWRALALYVSAIDKSEQEGMWDILYCDLTKSYILNQ